MSTANPSQQSSTITYTLPSGKEIKLPKSQNHLGKSVMQCDLCGGMITVTQDGSLTEMDSEDDICMWTIGHEQLEEVLQLAWADLDPDSEDIISNVNMLPAITKVNLPYKKEHGMQFFQLKFKVADFFLKMMCPS